MKLQITLRDTEKIHSDYILSYRLRECSLTRDWLKSFVKNFANHDHPIEKTYCLHGWSSSFESLKGRSVQFLCDKLNSDIDIINKDLNPKGYEFIDLHFDVESMKNQIVSRDLLNHIHHHFESLIGQVWAPSKWIGMAQQRTRDAIRNLNNICHELEATIRCIRYSFPPQINISLNGKDFQGQYFQKNCVELTLENYQDFLTHSEWGTINIYYSQLGKTFKEAFNDNDDYIKDSNISAHRYLTGEFILAFYTMNSPSSRFIEWLKEKELDPEDPFLGINHPVIGHLENRINRNLLFMEMRKRDDLYKIELIDDSGKILCTKIYDYIWSDQQE